MPEGSFWQRLDAPRWVHNLAASATTLLCVLTGLALLAGVRYGVPQMAVLPGALAALSGWMTSAWRRGRPWSWWVWAVGAGIGVASALGALLSSGPSWSSVLGLGLNGALLLLLGHPDSRARIQARAPGPRSPVKPGASGQGRSHRGA
jgi:hypothetical protein